MSRESTAPAPAPPPAARHDLLCVGEALVELAEVAGPEGARHFRAGHGGDTSNAAVAAARLGARAAYLSAVGDDAFGADLLALWDREGVDRSGVAVTPGAPTGLYFVTYDAGGHRFTYRRAGSAAALMGPGDLPPGLPAAALVTHASGISQGISPGASALTLAALGAARAAGRAASYDTNLRPALWSPDRARPAMLAALRLATVALPGMDDARLLFGLDDPDAVIDAVLALGPGVAALTLGAEGSIVATARERRRLPPHPVAAVDATGAGDAFDGAFLTEWLRTGDPFAAGRFANAAAALSTLGRGAVGPLPTRAAVEALLAAA